MNGMKMKTPMIIMAMAVLAVSSLVVANLAMPLAGTAQALDLPANVHGEIMPFKFGIKGELKGDPANNSTQVKLACKTSPSKLQIHLSSNEFDKIDEFDFKKLDWNSVKLFDPNVNRPPISAITWTFSDTSGDNSVLMDFPGCDVAHELFHDAQKMLHVSGCQSAASGARCFISYLNINTGG